MTVQSNSNIKKLRNVNHLLISAKISNDKLIILLQGPVFNEVKIYAV